MRILIIGATGVLGSRLYSDAKKKRWNTVGTFCSHGAKGILHLDVRDVGSMEKAFKLSRPEFVVMTGGITDVDLCTLKPGLADDVNVKGTLSLAKKIKEYDTKLVYISTDYVFNGEKGPYSEKDKTCPINKYGKTKLGAEKIIQAALKDFLIVRTSQLYGVAGQGVAQDRNFAVKIIHNMRNGKKVYAADDFYSTPTYAGLLSKIVIGLIEKNSTGIYNGAGPEYLNRYEYVNKIADIFNLDKKLIQKVKLRDLKLKAKRPKKGGLKIDKILKEKIAEAFDCEKGLRFLKKDMPLPENLDKTYSV